MKNSRISIQSRLPPRPLPQAQPKPGISSLKAIMNQGRVPLSQYIQQRPQHQNSHSNNYFDKLKAMISYQPEEHHRQKEKNNTQQFQPQNNTKMDIEQVGNHWKNYLEEFQGTDNVSPLRLETSCYKNKERSRSIQACRYPPSCIKMRPSQLPNQSTIPDRPQTQTEHNDKAPINGYYIGKGGKHVKKETIDYKKFKSTLGDGQLRWLELQQQLGCGANATVRSGRERHSSRQFAVKIYQKYKLIQPKRKKRVAQEIDILSKLTHPNIIKLTHCFEDKRQIHLLFEFIPEAQTLQQYIRLHSYRLPDALKRQVGIKIAEAIQYLHALGISHRDIKTENVIIGRGQIIKLIDFGFATTTVKGETLCGTPNYMAPQLLVKKGVYNPFLVDIWAFGILLFYLHEGCYPFRGYNEKDLIRNISSGQFAFNRCQQENVRKVIQGALAIEPNTRISLEQCIKLLKH